MGRCAEDERKRGRERGLEREEGVRGDPGDEGAGPLATERETARRERRAHSEPGEQQGMAWHAHDRAERIAEQLRESLRERCEDAPVRARIGAKAVGCVLDRPDERDGAPVRQRMRERHVRVDPLEPVLSQTQPGEERRSRRHRVDRRADVVHEAWQRQRRAPGTASDGRLRLVDAHAKSGPCELDGCGEPIRATPHDDGVGHDGRVSSQSRRDPGRPTVLARPLVLLLLLQPDRVPRPQLHRLLDRHGHVRVR